jgi:hypothetical protein
VSFWGPLSTERRLEFCERVFFEVGNVSFWGPLSTERKLKFCERVFFEVGDVSFWGALSREGKLGVLRDLIERGGRELSV